MLAREAAAAGHSVTTVGLPEAVGVKSTTAAEATGARIVALPLPVAEADGVIPTPLTGAPLPLSSVEHLLRRKVWGGRAGPALTSALQRSGAVLIDPNDSETYAIPNAALSAEGAIVSALARYPGSAAGANALIVGYGRIGRVLARLISRWDARVCVCARDPVARAWAQADGHQTADMDALAQKASLCDILFQTAPAPLVDKTVIAGMRPGTLVSDLTRCGVNIEAAEERGLIAWRDGGIPGKYAPEAAAKILYEELLRGDSSDS
jgi:dipicolinate synthase subunit A